ncbi:TRAP-type C4-dicarboxylate transport system permease small subunit [Evansella vedderi]|uniref:TRAP-type C4-dicarboxylate transport system permease small subunit n=1 Tax=Evansella vedderi TaxID=38282 RepID=A0ABT9ZRB5_9BACI|nr:TRAP transporter small permease [Evansella vedderi]MDQ0252998.1 TRAP-type C4-dicarboxylate transport system permease small subunit [Evansella vedderi]
MEPGKKRRSFNFIDKTVQILDLAACGLMALLTLVVFSEVLSRYVFNYPLVFSNELTQLLFPWTIFLGIIAVTKNEGHLSITFFRELLPKAMQKLAFIFSKLVMLYFSFYMLVSSYNLAQTVSNQVLPMLRISRAWLFYSVVVSFAAITIILIYQLVLIFMNKLEPPREEDLLDDMDNAR